MHGPHGKHSLYYLLTHCVGKDVLLSHEFACVGMCVPSHCLAMGIHVTIYIYDVLSVYADSYKLLHCVQYFMGVQVWKCVLVKDKVGFLFKIISKLCVICSYFLFLSLSWLGCFFFPPDVLVFYAMMVCVCLDYENTDQVTSYEIVALSRLRCTYISSAQLIEQDITQCTNRFLYMPGASTALLILLVCGSAHVVSLLSAITISMENAYSGKLEICILYFLSKLPVMMRLNCEYMVRSLFLNSMVISKLCDIFLLLLSF